MIYTLCKEIEIFWEIDHACLMSQDKTKSFSHVFLRCIILTIPNLEHISHISYIQDNLKKSQRIRVCLICKDKHLIIIDLWFNFYAKKTKFIYVWKISRYYNEQFSPHWLKHLHILMYYFYIICLHKKKKIRSLIVLRTYKINIVY